MHRYVPSTSVHKTIDIPDAPNIVKAEDTFHHILIGRWCVKCTWDFEDCFVVVAEAHVVAAALKIFKMSSVEDTPCHELFPDGLLDLDSLERRNVTMLAVANIVEQLVEISFREEQPAKQTR